MHRVTLEWRDGREATVDVAESETVINVTEREGVVVPYGCLYGACGTCTGRLLEGNLVHSERPRGLKPRHRQDGYVLLCVAEPRSDCRIEVGARVQADLVPNPWK
ncbi:ferredoxin-1 [Halalkalicoccus paucihalophilus]|uniref:Ferredoxin-1 n=1 Tax=Halalkalicoccus paucihalophilus TaxID=1008153 RepID=A0A151AAP0_9EURY|nr:2Fe-2S iron-sulfur cluster-binding protein [Halalkalicoccus paucihalophilus]KYH24705.1 ferredoxin-1 [Halalkalicoccus paucihalophilus]